MKYFILIWAGLWRKKMRTIFTMLSVVVAFLLFGLLQGFNLGMDTMVDNLNASRLYTSNKYSMTEGLPVAQMNQIKSVEGVTHVSHWTFFGGFFQESKNALPAFATNAREMFSLYDEIELSPGALDRMERTRNGLMVATPVAERFGWKVGETIPVGTSIWTNKEGSNYYQMEIVEIYDPAPNGMGMGVYLNYDYFDEARQFGNGTIHYFIVGVDDPRRGGEIATEIDALFANSTNETRTQTEQALAASQLKQVADIGFIVNSIVGAVLFTLLFLTGNSMMQSMRERIPELAILKTLGYSNAKVAWFVMSESFVLCITSALVGLALAAYLFTLVPAEMMGDLAMPPVVVAAGILMAALLALASGAPPTWRAQKLNIIDALAGR